MSISREAGEKYIQERRIPELFQTLTVGLVYHRPNDAIQFLIDGLEKLRPPGTDTILWDALLPSEVTNGQPKSLPHSAVLAEVSNDQPKSLPQSAPPSKKSKAGRRGKPRLHRSQAVEGSASLPSATDKKSVQKQEAENAGDKERPDFVPLVSQQPEVEKIFNDPDVMAILLGQMDDLPPMPSNIVRIFLSSTFTDFKAERNTLPRGAYPELQKFCAEYGLDFQVVDMRWGVTDELMNDHLVSELCLREIDTCKKVSCGPNFVTFLGNRYGHRPFPSTIEGTEFETCAEIAQAQKMDDSGLLLEWYTKDDNAVPPNYVLQPIATKLPYYNDMSEENAAKRLEDKATWNTISSKLQSLLRNSVQIAVDQGLLDPACKSKYFISVTEQEIHEGLLKSSENYFRSLCFHRHLDKLEEDSEKSRIGRFIDLNSDLTINEEAKTMMMNLTTDKVKSLLPEDNVTEYSVPWTGKALEASQSELHLEYLSKFSNDFVDKMKRSIDLCQVMDKSMKKDSFYGKLYLEVLHHAKFANMKSQLFCGREDIIEQVREFLTQKSGSHSPLVIHGKSGYGKTALLSYIAKCTKTWLHGQCHLIIRLFGTSPQSSNIFDVIHSIIYQLHLSLKNTPPAMEDFQMGDLRRSFWSLLNEFAHQHPDSHLVIILDSVDQLSEAYRAHHMHWLPRRLPSNVHVIISMLSDKYHCLENAEARLQNTASFIELPPLSDSIGGQIIDVYMESAKRKLQPEQRALVMSAFEKCRQPLFLKLVVDEAVNWYSYTPVASLRVATSVHEAIDCLFEGLEVKYGAVFVPRALAYLTCSKGGLTGVEMEDFLSCDDEVLNEVYQYHDPPLEDTIRIPSLMWARVQDHLKEYLTERQVDGKTVMAWYHRQFWEAAEGRYLDSEEVKKQIHGAMAEVYQQTDGIRKSITLVQRKGLVMQNADRGVQPQLLVPKNLRKLSCLPYHLLHSGDLKMLRETCMLNYHWLRIKLEAVGVAEVFRELQMVLEAGCYDGDEAVRLLHDFLERCYSALHYDASLLAFHTVEMLSKFTHVDPLLASFVKDADEWMQTTELSLMIPTHPIKFLGLDSPLKFTKIVGHDGVLTSDETKIVCNWSEQNSNAHKIQTFDLRTKDILASLNVAKNSPLVVTKDDKNFAYIETCSLKLREIETGDLQAEYRYCKDEYESVTPRAIAISQNGRYIALGSKFGKPKAVVGQEKWKTNSCICIADLETPDDASRLHSTDLHCRKVVDCLTFVSNDTILIASTKERLIMFSVPTLEMVKQFQTLPPLFGGVALHHVGNCLAFGAGKDTAAKMVLFNCETQTHQTSKKLSIGEKEDYLSPIPFAIKASDDLSRILMGAATLGNSAMKRSSLWVWNTDDDDIQTIQIGVGQWKLASQFAVSPDWKFVIVGWNNGDLSIVHMESATECLVLPYAHGHCVNYACFTQNHVILTLALDHSLKYWSADLMFKQAEENLLAPSRGETQEEESVNSCPILEPDEQCLDLALFGEHILTVTFQNEEGPRSWRLIDGSANQALTKQFNATYKASLVDRELMELNRGHAHFDLYQDKLFYARRRRDGVTLCVMTNLTDPTVQAHVHFSETYLTLVACLCTGGKEELVFYALKDGILEMFDGDLHLRGTSDVPKLSDDIINLSSSAGKKKLLMMKMAVTSDGKYVVIINPAAQRKGKLIDMVDVENRSYKGRAVNRYLPWRILEDSFCYLVILENDSEEATFQIHGPSSVSVIKQKVAYKCLLQGETNCLSPDHTHGFEVSKSHSVKVWKLKPFNRLHHLRGHIREVQCGSFSQDNRFLSTGSLDNTVRLWSVEHGNQLCMFHMYGGVTKVLFDSTSKFVAVHFAAGPQRRRAAILRVTNL